MLKSLSSIIRGGSKLYFLAVGMVCAAGLWAAIPMEAASLQNQSDPGSPTKVVGNAKAGKIFFERHCVTCHGPRGRGDGLEIAGATVADLSSPTTQRKLNPDLLATIHEGRPGKAMPSWKWRLSAEESRNVLAYVRTLSRK